MTTLDGQDYVTLLAAVIGLAGLVGTVISTLSSTDTQKNGHKRLTPAGAIALGIAVIAGLGSIGSEFLKRQIEINNEHKDDLEAANNHLIHTRDVQFQAEIRAWDKKTAATAMTIKGNTDESLNQQSDTFKKIVAGFSGTQRSFVENNRKIQLSTERLMLPIGSGYFSFTFEAVCNTNNVSIYCGLLNNEKITQPYSHKLNFDEFNVWAADLRDGIVLTVCIIRTKVVADRYVSTGNSNLCERSNDVTAYFGPWNGASNGRDDNNQPYIRYIPNASLPPATNEIVISIDNYQIEAPQDGSHGLDSMIDLRGAFVFIIPFKSEFESLAMWEVKIKNSDNISIRSSNCKKTKFLKVGDFEDAPFSFLCIFDKNASFEHDAPDKLDSHPE